MLKICALIIATCAASTSAQERRELPPMPPDEKVFTWLPGKPHTDAVYSDGAHIRVIRNGDVAVAVFGYDSGDYLVCEVSVANGTQGRFDVKPADFFMTYHYAKKKFDYAFSLPPKQVAAKYRGRAKWGNFFRAFAAGMATTTAQTSVAGRANVYGSDGTSAAGTYSGTATTTAPDLAARSRAAEANRRATDAARGKADEVIEGAFFANTLYPQTYASGLVYFERKKKFEASFLYVYIDGTAYVFGFGPAK